MSLALLLPAGLAALAAVLLPLLIHLARRSEQRPTAFAALQWLRPKPRPRHRIRFDEWPLLLVRLLLLILLAVLLARPVLSGAADTSPWVAVAPGIDAQQARAVTAPPGARWHWLTPGFPALDRPPIGTPAAPHASLTSLLRELDSTLPAAVALTVIVPGELDGVDAQRPVLSRRVRWQVLPTAPAGGSAPKPLPPPRLSVRYAPQRAGAVRYLRAAHAAWHPPRGDQAPAEQDIATVGQPLPASADPLVWLAPGPLPQAVLERVRNGGIVLVEPDTQLPDAGVAVTLWTDDAGATLVEGRTLGRGRLLRLTRPLDAQAMPVLLEGDFPHRLRGLFEPAPVAPARVRADAHTPLTGARAYALPPQALEPWLLALIALVFLAERVMATGRRKRAAP